MAPVIRFNVVGDPVGEGRPRSFIRGGHARQAPCTVADDWKALVAIEALKHVPEKPMNGPVCVDLVFRFRRPKKHFRAGKSSAQLRDDAPAYHIGRPDRDNLEKAILDVLTNIGMWHDDCQVCCGGIIKVYTPIGSLPGVHVEVSEV